jgi:hypothetical protein
MQIISLRGETALHIPVEGFSEPLTVFKPRRALRSLPVQSRANIKLA